MNKEDESSSLKMVEFININDIEKTPWNSDSLETTQDRVKGLRYLYKKSKECNRI